MTQTQTAVLAQPKLILTPPDVIEPVTASSTVGVVQLPPEFQARMQTKVSGFVTTLLTEDVQSDAFRHKLDQSFAVGQAEIAGATKMTSEMSKRNFIGQLDSPAYKAIGDMRTLFDELNPARQGDLFAPNKIFGITVPFGNKLTSYFRRYESAGKQIQALYQHIQDAQVDVEKCVSELGGMRTKLYDNILKLEAVVYFVNELDRRLESEIEALRLTDSARAKALEQEVLYYVRQNLGDVQSARALTITAYNSADMLRRTGRETINGCNRVSNLGLSALELAVLLAGATGVQIKTMAMVTGSKQIVEDLIIATGEAQKSHVKATIDFASNPILGIQTLQQMFAATDEAMEMMSTFRTAALGTMKTNNELVQSMVTSQMARIENERQAVGVTA